jgi:glycosyltransferase involved in cell wall biosynthesis
MVCYLVHALTLSTPNPMFAVGILERATTRLLTPLSRRLALAERMEAHLGRPGPVVWLPQMGEGDQLPAGSERIRSRLQLRGPQGRRLRVAHLTTVDMSLAVLLGTELECDVAAGLVTFGISAPGPYVASVERLGVEHVALRSLTRTWDVGRDLQAAGQLWWELHQLKLDVLHTHNPKTGVLGRVMGRAAGIPVVVNTCHGLWAGPDSPAAHKALVYGAEGVAARFSDAELFQNAEDMHTMRRALRCGAARVVGNGVDLNRFVPGPERRRRTRQELGVRPDELLVGGVGRMVAEKGMAEYAFAARELGHRAQFVWIGPQDPDKSDALKGELAGVRLLGSRDAMEAVYPALDVFVLPSYREGFSRSGMEAAACGVATVLSDIRGCREVGVHERELLLVPPRDPGALTAAIGRLLEDTALRVRLGEAARARALTHFDQRAVAATSLETYAAVARRKRLGWSE